MALVALGAMATFAVFASTTITNIALPGTNVMGDMGLFPGFPISGFPPGFVSGSTYAGDSFASIVKADAKSAYNDAKGQASTVIMTSEDLVGKTLLPGVYKFASSASLSAGELHLDANGNAHSVWIFQIGSSLDVAPGATMNFTGGVGNANNVFWQVGSSVTLLSNSVFIGNVIAKADISCQSDATVNGRLVSLGAAITLFSTNVSFPPPLPVTPPPDLGTFATFAVFASSTISNFAAPGTVVTGDMGIFPGTAFVGFPPGRVTGTKYSAGAYAGIVKGDAQVAYLAAALEASTATMTNIDLGGLTLAPGVYKFAADAALSGGQLFLDAKGDPNAVWTFQIGSSLTIAAGTHMFFTGGLGNSNNVIWQVGTSATLGAGSGFIGNVLAYASVICMAKASVNGRLLGLNGAVTLTDNTISFADPTVAASPTRAPTVAPTTESEGLSAGGGTVKAESNVGMIVGVVVAGVVVVAVLAAAVVYNNGKHAGELAAVPVNDKL